MKSNLPDDVLLFVDDGWEVEPLPEGVQAELVFKAERKTHQLSRSRTILGRKKGDLLIDDPQVSERHATIGYHDGLFFVVDLHSKNQTFVNGNKVVEAVLKEGDVIRIGATDIEFHLYSDLASSIETWQKKKPSVAEILDVMFGESRQWTGDTTRIIISGSPQEIVKAPLIEVILRPVARSEKKQYIFAQNEILVGRDHGDLAMKDPDVSKKHAVIEVFGPDQIFIKDLGSTNGTFVNGKKVARIRLHDHDQLRFGTTDFVFKRGKLLQAKKGISSDQGCITLRVVTGALLGQIFDVAEGVWTIGDEESDLDLKDQRLKGCIAKLHVAPTKFQIEDLGAADGIYVNGRKVRKCLFEIDDVLRFGDTELKVTGAKQDPQSIEEAIHKAGYRVD